MGELEKQKKVCTDQLEQNEQEQDKCREKIDQVKKSFANTQK